MTPASPSVLQLKDIPAITQGRMRMVYRHPEDPRLLVKVIRPDIIDQRWGSGAPWYKSRRRYRQYISYIRETEEYIAAYASHGGSLPFAQKIVGFAETDLGLGLVMEAALDRDGNLAPALPSLFQKQAFDRKVSEDLEEFLNQVVESDLIVADLNSGNIVYAYDAAREKNHFVLVDGLGVSTVLPFKLLSRALNRRSKRGRVKRLRVRMARMFKRFPQPDFPDL
jgi:hypothetical protein